MNVERDWRRFGSPWDVDYWRRGKEEGGVDSLLWCCGRFWFGWIASVKLDGPPTWIHGVIGSQRPKSAGIDMRSGLVNDRDGDTTYQTASHDQW